MLIAPPTTDETQRLALLRSLDLLDSAPEPAFDTLTRLVVQLLQVPVALISLVDEQRQWFKSRVGLEATETPRDIAFCAHAIHGDLPFVVPDARLDLRFADNPLVTTEPQVRAYAGITLRSSQGHALGTLCAIDHKPREFSPAELHLLTELAGNAQREIQHREAAVHARQQADSLQAMLAQQVAECTAELQRSEAALARLNHEQGLMLDNDLVGIVKLRQRRIVWHNRAMARMFGYRPGELTNRPTRELYPSEAAYQALGEASHAVLSRGDSYRVQLQLVRQSGEPIWVDMAGTLLSAETGESLWLLQDISAMRLHQEQVEQMAFHDPLTGLPNRLLLQDRLRQALATGSRAHERVAVCFIDLDGFKAVNDSQGHGAGDEVLQIVAARLLACVRGHDTVARIGGDEFVLVLSRLAAREECDLVLDRVLADIKQPMQLADGSETTLTASMGVAFYPEDGLDPTRLLATADDAMYRAKQSRRERLRPR
ncbi:MAG TPA: diguanylate cyclase [Ideonella sp.]|uniref:diguanylate cyclase domain-containing protein n=1 Tax=Ideonella sp. TaxID=1929293 RepID=UPI002B8DA7A2|nr:diguanylate cyclase [Ideonella sp.]HSI51395.1 diguanylate cyclase [Ideonella sp.]